MEGQSPNKVRRGFMLGAGSKQKIRGGQYPYRKVTKHGLTYNMHAQGIIKEWGGDQSEEAQLK